MRVDRTKGQKKRLAATWVAGLCTAALTAAGAVITPAAVATAAPDPELLVVQPVPTEVIASAEELAGLGTAVDAHLAGGNLFVEVRTAAGTRRGYWRPLDGSRSWSKMWGGRVLTGDLLASERDVLLLDVGTTDVLAWSRDGGGNRTVPEGTVLGRGAQHVVYLSDADPEHPRMVTQPVTGGDQILVVAPDSGEGGTFAKLEDGLAIAGDRLFGVDNAEFSGLRHVQRWNVTTGIPVGWDGYLCDRESLHMRVEDARGRFALASCADGRVSLTADSAQVYDDVTLAVHMKRTLTPPQLGNGFVLGVSATSGELLAAPYLGGSPGTLGEATAFDLDDTGTSVVLVDDAGDVRIARDLRSWSSTPATEITDNAAPEAVPVWASERVPVTHDTARFRTEVGGTDYGTPPFLASGIAEQEVRYRIRLAGESDFSDWMSVPPAEVREYPAPSRICWVGRVTDHAGNVSAWTEETCQDTVGTTNQVEAAPMPAAVKADADGTTTVLYESGGMDGERLAGKDIRYRWFAPGETPPDWTVRKDSGDFELETVPTEHHVCFQARGYDFDGSVSDWMAERCTFTDGTLPLITSAAYPRWVKPSQTSVVSGVRTANPTFRWIGGDDFGIEGYSVQRSLSRTTAGAERPFWTTGTSHTRPLTEAGQHCFHVRAKDLAGHLGPWSGWRCSTMPVSAAKLDGQSFGPYLHRVWPGKGDLVTTRGYSGVAIYAKVNTGPRYGNMKVYMGSRFLGTVNAHATEAGSKWVWLSPGGRLDGKVRFVANAGDFVDLREFYISR